MLSEDKARLVEALRQPDPLAAVEDLIDDLVAEARQDGYDNGWDSAADTYR